MPWIPRRLVSRAPPVGTWMSLGYLSSGEVAARDEQLLEPCDGDALVIRIGHETVDQVGCKLRSPAPGRPPPHPLISHPTVAVQQGRPQRMLFPYMLFPYMLFPRDRRRRWLHNMVSTSAVLANLHEIPCREGYHAGRDTMPGGIPCSKGCRVARIYSYILYFVARDVNSALVQSSTGRGAFPMRGTSQMSPTQRSGWPSAP